MQRFSLDRRRFAGHPRRGFPHPSGGSPSPSKSPPEGGDPTPQGAGACRPPVRPSAAPSTPRGTPTGFPRLRRLPLPSGLAAKGASEARRALARRGVEKNQSGGADCGRRPPAVEMWGRPGSRWAGVGAAGGQPPGCPRGVPAPVHGPRSAGRSRSDLHISTAGGPTWPPLGAFSAPQGSRLPFRKSSEYTCLSSGPPEARF